MFVKAGCNRIDGSPQLSKNSTILGLRLRLEPNLSIFEESSDDP
jgi:hypothetical protein